MKKWAYFGSFLAIVMVTLLAITVTAYSDAREQSTMGSDELKSKDCFVKISGLHFTTNYIPYFEFDVYRQGVKSSDQVLWYLYPFRQVFMITSSYPGKIEI